MPPRRIRTQRRDGLAALVLVAALAGCGGDDADRPVAPRLPAPLATELAAASDAVAARLDAGDACAARREAQRLHARTVAAVNAGRIPPRYQEELTGATAALAARIACVPPPPPPPAAEDEAAEENDGGGGGKGKGRGKGRGKGKGK